MSGFKVHKSILDILGLEAFHAVAQADSLEICLFCMTHFKRSTLSKTNMLSGKVVMQAPEMNP